MPITPKQLPAAKSPIILAGMAGGYSLQPSFPVEAKRESTPENDKKFISCPANYDKAEL
jgi:hypothetical protein